MQLQLSILLSLLAAASAVNWQAADNITQSNRTFIWSTIDNNIATYAPSNLAPFSQFISNTLNKEWDPAWNVFVFQLIDPSLDAVVYGYAFRKHWMWFNGYSYGGNTYSFVIWKDYNCLTWHTISNADRQTRSDPSVPNYGFLQTLSTVHSQIMSSYDYNQLWTTIYNIGTKLEANTGNGYSIVAVKNGLGYQDAVTNMNGRFCSAGGAESFLFARLGGFPNGARYKLIYIKTR